MNAALIQRLRCKAEYLFSHTGFKKYFENTSWLIVEKVLRMGLAIFIGIWVARYLGPKQYGIFSYAQAFVALFSAFASLGLDSILVRELVAAKDDYRVLLGTAFSLKLTGSLVVLLFLTGITSMHLSSNDHLTNALILLIAASTIFQSFSVIALYFESRVQSRYTACANICSLLVTSLIKVGLILSAAPLIAFAAVLLLEAFLTASGLSYFYLKHHPNFEFRRYIGKISLAANMLKSSWPLLLSGLVISVYMKIDQVMIKNLLGDTAVGEYAVAVKLSGIWYFIPVAISSSLFPAIINSKKRGEKVYYGRLGKLYTLLTALAIAIALPVTLAAGHIINILYGDAYQRASGVLMIHIWSGLFVFLGVASEKWLINEHLQIFAFWRTFCGMVSNIALNLVLIPRYGIEGAAAATLISYSIAALWFDLLFAATRISFFLKIKSLFIWRLL